MKNRLYDASSLINVVRIGGSQSIRMLDGHHVLDLTIYEVSNVMWKLVYREKKITQEQSSVLLDSVLLLMQRMKVVSIGGLEKHVQELAVREGLTAYDASYLAVAEHLDLVLVTDDRKLERAGRKYVKVLKTSDF
ncbi:MAG: type II toxin-antitoxin system VapC family toxin [Thaumarchaeota archaeon]|nr:type II toxin-antitoxin system VapC family toxin [Nitrososphaerota archaeon]